MTKTVIAAALGECVHVAGISNFLRLAESVGWKTIFLGPAVPIEEVIRAAEQEKADLVGVSYRLTPETGERLLGEFAEAADDLHSLGVKFAFGGTPPVAEKARKLGFFERIFDGNESPEMVLAYLKGQENEPILETDYPHTMIERIQWKSPFPLIRHHFGLPTMQKTLNGIKRIASTKALDVISLGIDQDAQENFFHPERQDPRRKGAGGVPVRLREEYEALYAASRCGNFPIMRTYSGTDDFIQLAEMYLETINQAWCAIPLFWFNQMDGRGPWDLEGSIREHQQVMKWYGERHIPVELNEPHHWGMRDAPDVVFVVAAYLAAYNARAFGVKDYIAQLMFNSPPGLSDAMDLAKMMAVLLLVEPLTGPDFRMWKQTRTGLLSYPVDPNAARGHLATNVYLQMALKPHIIHIVGFTEAHHAALAEDVIESCGIARRAIENALRGAPEMISDPSVRERAYHLAGEAQVTLKAIHSIAGKAVADPLTDPFTLAQSVACGILDAPQLRNNPFGQGKIVTRILQGGCDAVGPDGKPLSEATRLAEFLDKED
ncbi:MAG: cobalamin B12-binding domain-containing protein [Anaerolineaceae bacterium]|nr:cobalamin B12-binding domain-containing protein [Anaerolineaceae bacterium]